jgi:pimeloyl-ACP methyl ester carboxylesterase
MKLIFIHGSGGSSVVWEQQTDVFEGAIALDLPGHPEGELLPSVEAYALWLSGYLDQLNEAEVVLIGHSLGSAIVMALAQKGHPALKGLVLIGAGARLKVMPGLLQSLDAHENGDGLIPEAFLTMNQGVPKQHAERINASMRTNGAKALLSDLRACDAFDVMDSLSCLTLPTQIVVGDQDSMTPPKYAKFLYEHIDGSQLALVPGGSHMVLAEQADVVNGVISRFVSQL